MLDLHNRSLAIVKKINGLDIKDLTINLNEIASLYQTYWYWPLVSGLINGLLVGFVLFQIQSIGNKDI